MNRWTEAKAAKWQAAQPWLVGCNFNPSTAINQLEMWQGPTFDPVTIDRELGWAAGIGMNVLRVYLHDLAYAQDVAGFLGRMDQFLGIATQHGIRPGFAFFDDCWNHHPRPGRQPKPSPGVHNSGWVQSPSKAVALEPASWGRLEEYVQAVLRRFARDGRVAYWDLYNEPGNGTLGAKSLPLLEAVFKWAWAVRPDQPLTAGVWALDVKENDHRVLEEYMYSASDIITFHDYETAEHLANQIASLRKHKRPLLCTEWLRRPVSMVVTHLPVFKKEGVGCINWGCVWGKTQTIYPWGSPGGGPEPNPWFHDLFRADGTPFSEEEAQTFRTLTGRA